MTTAGLSFTRVDPAVLSELPQEVRDELTALLPTSNKATHTRPDRHANAMTHFEGLRQQHGFEAKYQRQTHNAETDSLGLQARSPLADETAQDLWQALQGALLQLARQLGEGSRDIDDGTRTDSSHEQCDDTVTVSKLNALQDVALQWVVAHVQLDLEDVHWLLRRLSGLRTHVELVQQTVAHMMHAVQQQVKEVHGAMLQTRLLLL